MPHKASWGFFTSMFFQKLKHRAHECASVLLYCSVTAYLHQRMTCYRDSYQESSWHGRIFLIGSCRFSKRRRRSERYPVLRITVPQKCDESGFRSLPNARIPWAIRKWYVSSLSSLRTLIQARCFDVTHWSRSGGQGLCDRCPRCICCGDTNFSRCNFFLRISK